MPPRLNLARQVATALAALALAAPIHADAVVLMDDVDPMTSGVHILPLEDRAPDAGQSLGDLAGAPAFATTDAVTDTAVVRSPISGVPEPAAWGMMILGVGLTGSALRRRRARRAAF